MTPAGRAVAGADAVEGLAEQLNDPGVDNRAGVADADAYPSGSRAGAGLDLYGPAAGVVADRVSEQVAYRLPQQRKVRGRLARGQAAVDGDAAVGRLRGDVPDRGRNGRRHVNGTGIEVGAAGVGEVKERLDDRDAAFVGRRELR